MTDITTEPGGWLLAEYTKTPGDPKWYPGTGLEVTIIAIEQHAAAAERARIRQAVEGLPVWYTGTVDRAAVLALLEADR